ncbi:DUF2147 domain-containing protein [Chitinimonas sp. BJYL2]|uniref:DUF2147 domain-containing protein n=1 Tax=Chitinimonas sp. BJYL2 TaxID=2976696 RepID=UPI0022B3E792|nr:DUF2147 domain-containing protein [Chitinimonas sp. BJYL2]
MRTIPALFASLLALTAPLALADSPVGIWKNVSDKTGKVEALIEISDVKGELRGKLVKLMDPKETVCKECPGDKKNAPLMGLEIIWGVKKDGDEWAGGKILDPNNGKIYSVKMALLEAGKKLEVRGFLGFSLLGRSQVWHRDQ